MEILLKIVVVLEPYCLHDPQESGSIDVQPSRTASQAQQHVGSRFIQDAADYFPALRRKSIDKTARPIELQS
jgi:hypothetical protein